MRPSRSRRRRRLTTGINALSGAVAVGSLIVVLELGAPVTSNLGLGVGLPSVGHGGNPAQALASAGFPTLGPSSASVMNATAPESVAPPAVEAAPSGMSAVVSSASPTVAEAPSVTTTAGPSSVSSHALSAAAVAAAPASGESAGAQAIANVRLQSTSSDAPNQGGQQGDGDGHGQSGSHGQGNGQGQGGGQSSNNGRRGSD